MRIQRYALGWFAFYLKAAVVVHGQSFERLSTFFICSQGDLCNTDTETVAEIVDATADGNTLVYTDGEREVVGFVDITNAANPMPIGTVAVGGEPTSVAISETTAFVAVNTSPDFINATGLLHAIDVTTQTVLKTWPLPGQPDSVAVKAPYVAIVLENERDEDLGDGGLPQLPAGALVIVTMNDVSDVESWTMETVGLTGLGDSLDVPEDPEPEYVVINDEFMAVITLQENNALVLVDLPSAQVVAAYSAGSIDLTQVDVSEEDVITADGSLTNLVREPDAVTWLADGVHFATANEGDWKGGSRGFSIFNSEDGSVVYDSGNSFEHSVMRYGHYPESRSENKGSEPEGIVAGQFGGIDMLFVTSERGNLVLVYDVTDPAAPQEAFVLPTNVGPEGLLPIPGRDLFIAACEVDSRGDKIRAGINIFQWDASATPTYPTLESIDREDGTPIPFSALSGLASAPWSTTLYAVEDSYYKQSRILAINTATFPYMVVGEVRVTDENGVFAELLASTDFTGILNDDGTVNIDLEGISIASEGGFWLVHEGRGTVGDEARPVESPNVLFKVSREAVIEQVILLPDELNAVQLRFGMEGVAEDGTKVVVAMQRAWNGEANPRIAVYDTVTSEWMFYFYPLDVPISPNGGWVGLSDISAMGDGKFLVLERDNQGGPDAAIKKVYSIDLGDFSMAGETLLEKTMVKDLLPTLMSFNGPVFEKVEGMAIDGSGDVWIVNDNDGVDDNSGEQRLINLGAILPVKETSPTKCVRRQR